MKLTKKAAMFGKLSQLNHFNLTSLRAKRGNLLSKTGAMFGLDARIALAIFGALSVISGAALFNAIQDSNVTSIVNEAKELEKAMVAYILDVGEFPTYNTDSAALVHIEELVEDPSKLGWNGPYTDLVISSAHIGTSAVIEGPMYVRLGDKVSAAADQRRHCTVKDPSEKACSAWLEWYEIPESIADAVDLHVDGTADRFNGRIRYCAACGLKGSMFFRLNVE